MHVSANVANAILADLELPQSSLLPNHCFVDLLWIGDEPYMSAATGPGGLDYETLHRKLSLVRSYVDPKVLNQMIRFFAPQIPLADQQLLSQLMTQLRPVH